MSIALIQKVGVLAHWIRFVVGLAFIPWLLGQTGCTGAPESTLPNVIIMLTDDLGYDDLGCYWTPNDEPGFEKIETPNIDRMARNGVRFTDFYAAAPVCTASRAALLTGCYPPRVGLSRTDTEIGGVLFPRSRIGLNPDEVTLADLLKKKDYRTACIGKWHLGKQAEFLPTRQGFDTYYGLMFRRKAGNLIMRDERVVETIGDEELTTRFTEAAVDFIRRNHKRPFFIYLAHSMPHARLGVSERFAGKSPRGLYGDVVMELDWSTGQILETLEDLGISERTLLVFTSDNGPDVFGSKGLGKSYPLRGGKASAFEGGYRVPCVMYWPGRIPAGIVCGEMCTQMDLFPTIAGLARAEMPRDVTIDGLDIWPLIEGREGAASPHEGFFYYHKNELLAVRSGDWKLIFNTVRVVRDTSKHGERLLFNLRSDVGETTNVLARHPRIAWRLARLASAMREDLGDAVVGTEGRNRRPPGKIDGLSDGPSDDPPEE